MIWRHSATASCRSISPRSRTSPTGSRAGNSQLATAQEWRTRSSRRACSRGEPNAEDDGTAARADAVSGKIKDCAELGLQYLEARARGDATAATQIQDEIQFSERDPNWARTLEEYAKYFGPGGGLQPIPYIRAGKIGKQVLEMNPNARVALIVDWGTGTDAAVSLLQSVKRKSPDIVIHLGDVYNSGTEAECGNSSCRSLMKFSIGRGPPSHVASVEARQQDRQR